MKARKFFAFVAGAAMLFGGVACTPIEDGDEADSDMPELSVSPTSIATTLEGGEQVVTVTSNVNWTVSCDQEDVTIEPLAGSGDGSVTITVPAATAARNFVVTFEGIKKVTIPGIGTQDSPAKPVTVAVSQNDGGVNMDDYLFYENCGLDVEKVNGNWPYLDQFTAWGKQGSAAANVVYSGKNASVRHSGAPYQPTEDAIGVSGAPYAFLNKVPAEAYFVIENIAVTGGSNYIFTYNVSCQTAYVDSTPSFATVDGSLVHLELGYDGENWDAVECTFAPNGGNGWYAANAEFKVAADATTLYARFTYEAPASNGGGRFDDFKLVAGGNGAELAPEAPVVAETTIADIKAAGNYSVKNAWAVATYANGCLLTDASGKYLLAFKPSETPAVGEVINIEGGVSAYGGLLQFGEGSTVTKTGETKTVTHPTPEVLDGAKLDALTSALEVKYVEYEGTLAISSGKYFNITVAGASKQGSVQYPLDDMKATLNSLDGKTIKVTGYTIGYTSSKYLQTMATSVVEVEGTVTPDPTPDPEQPGEGGGETPETPATGYNFNSDAALVCNTSNSTNCVYTCTVKANGSSAVNGNGFKLGKSSAAGVFTSGALGVTGEATLEFYACAWTGKTAKLYIRLEGSEENLAVIDLASNSGATGNADPYTITYSENEYHTVQLTGLTADSKLQFSTSSSFTAAADSKTSRALVVGVHVK